MKKAFLFLFFCVGLLVQGQTLTQDKEKTTVDFKIKNLGLNVDGHFSEVTIASNFNKDNLSNSFINATIDVKSIDTGNDTRDESLSEEDYFDMSNYPSIILKSTSIKKSGNNYELEAMLTIKDTTKKISIPLTVTTDGKMVLMTANFELDRRDYDVGGNSWVMSDVVKINVNYQASY